jgi:hypothetical protein
MSQLTVTHPSKSAQARRQALFFISDWYGDNEAWSDTSRGDGKGRDATLAPDGSSNIESPELRGNELRLRGASLERTDHPR